MSILHENGNLTLEESEVSQLADVLAEWKDIIEDLRAKKVKDKTELYSYRNCLNDIKSVLGKWTVNALLRRYDYIGSNLLEEGDDIGHSKHRISFIGS